jgi:hypothetical protein
LDQLIKKIEKMKEQYDTELLEKDEKLEDLEERLSNLPI